MRLFPHRLAQDDLLGDVMQEMFPQDVHLEPEDYKYARSYANLIPFFEKGGILERLWPHMEYRQEGRSNMYRIPRSMVGDTSTVGALEFKDIDEYLLNDQFAFLSDDWKKVPAS
jgi:hypothetical protein